MGRQGYDCSIKEREYDWVIMIAAHITGRLRNVETITQEIIDIVVADEYRIMTEEIITHTSLWCVDLAARQIAMTLSYLLLDDSVDKIGKHYGDTDHTGIIRAYRKYGKDVSSLCADDKIVISPRPKGAVVVRREGPTGRLARKLRLASWLQAISICKDGPTLSRDIFPYFTQYQCATTIGWLRKLGYAVTEGIDKPDGVMRWQITEAGRQELAILQPLLDQYGHLQRAAPVNRTARSGRADSAPGRLDQPLPSGFLMVDAGDVI